MLLLWFCTLSRILLSAFESLKRPERRADLEHMNFFVKPLPSSAGLRIIIFSNGLFQLSSFPTFFSVFCCKALVMVQLFYHLCMLCRVWHKVP
jgi:hypothetical protein